MVEQLVAPESVLAARARWQYRGERRPEFADPPGAESGECLGFSEATANGSGSGAGAGAGRRCLHCGK